MDLYVAERAKWSVQEYAQRNLAMGGNRGSQGIQYRRGQTSSITIRSIFSDRRYQLFQLFNEKGLRSLDQALLMCEIVDPYTSRYSQVACAEAIKKAQIKPQDRLRRS